MKLEAFYQEATLSVPFDTLDVKNPSVRSPVSLCAEMHPEMIVYQFREFKMFVLLKLMLGR